ncbi:Ig-like domain-containing protein [Aurantivibrio plasticivorans]
MIESHYLQALLDGNLTLGFGVGMLGIVIAVLLVITLAAVSYWKTTRPLSTPWRMTLVALRSLTLVILAICLLDPGVLINEVKPQETYVAVVVDDSQSMSIRDTESEQSRQQQAISMLYGDGGVIPQLQEKFQVRSYRFSELAERVSNAEEFNAMGGASNIASGIERVMTELSAVPLAGVVVVTDGAHNTANDPEKIIPVMRQQQVPLYVVGVGQDNINEDLAILTVDANKTLLEGSVFNLSVGYSQTGFANQSTRLLVKDGDRIVASRNLVLSQNHATKKLNFDIVPDREEIIVYDVIIEELQGETITQNNHSQVYIDNRSKPALDILYVEGQPRNEYKFVQRALQGDPSLRLATYLQTGPRKFLRQGIKSPSELEGGFPRTVEELFNYEAIIFGNIERSFVNDQQLAMIKEFVAKRGGGFMVLGGVQEALVDSDLADILPIELVRESQLPASLSGGTRRGDHPTGTAYRPRMTKAGEYSPILRLDTDDKKNRDLWRAMPDLEGVYVTGRAKPGATVLLEHSLLQFQNQPVPILSTQNYGRGRSAVMSTASSWRWQMMMPHDDQSHERIWRQLVRWLAEDSKPRIEVQLDKENYAVGDPVVVTAKLVDENFEPVNDALLWLEHIDPTGKDNEQAMAWRLEGDGEYQAEFFVAEEGVHDITVRVPSALDENLEVKAPLLVTPSRKEFVQASKDAGLLKRLANNGNGKVYESSQADSLVNDITYSPNIHSQEKVQSLWDQPLVLAILLFSLSAEWGVRRFKGLS